MYYEDHGAGQPLVFLHGWGTSGRVWGAQLPDLVQDHRVITVDWRGSGRSSRPATGHTIANVARDIREFIDVLELPALVLAGSSIAGAFVIEAAPAELAGWPASSWSMPAFISSPVAWTSRCGICSPRCAPTGQGRWPPWSRTGSGQGPAPR